MIYMLCLFFMTLFIIFYLNKSLRELQKKSIALPIVDGECKIVLDECKESIEYTIRKIMFKNYFNTSIRKIKILYQEADKKTEHIKICFYLKRDYPNLIYLVKKQIDYIIN